MQTLEYYNITGMPTTYLQLADTVSKPPINSTLGRACLGYQCFSFETLQPPNLVQKLQANQLKTHTAQRNKAISFCSAVAAEQSI
jgi:hypothetical protein